MIRKIITIAVVLPKEWKVQVSCQTSQPRVPVPERGTQRITGFEGQQRLWIKVMEAVGNRDSTLESLMQNLKRSMTQHRANTWKEAWFKPMCLSWRVSQRSHRVLDSPRGIDVDNIYFGEVILSSGLWCWQAIFWSPSSSLLNPEADWTASQSSQSWPHLTVSS